jgi:hypothetical protein
MPETRRFQESACTKVAYRKRGSNGACLGRRLRGPATLVNTVVYPICARRRSASASAPTVDCFVSGRAIDTPLSSPRSCVIVQRTGARILWPITPRYSHPTSCDSSRRTSHSASPWLTAQADSASPTSRRSLALSRLAFHSVCPPKQRSAAQQCDRRSGPSPACPCTAPCIPRSHGCRRSQTLPPWPLFLEDRC